MKARSLRQIATDVAGTAAGDDSVQVTGAAADSRAVQPGDLFVAIPGERVDGHDFIGEAAAAGATAALSTRPSADLPTVVVSDPVAALGDLAAAVVAELPDLVVVGVTGSSGKTTTKDLLARVLAPLGAIVAPAGSMNTEVGLPVTALRCDSGTAAFVAEMGARGVGHVAYLCRVTPPTIGVVLNVGSAHLGEFGSRAAIAEAKGELVAALPASGTAVLNADDPLVAAMAASTDATVLRYGHHPGAELRIEDLELDDQARPTFWLRRGDERCQVQLQLSGEHNASNAAAAAAAGLSCGLTLPQVAAALSKAEPVSRWRMEVTRSPAGVTVVNDAYNANPDSMAAALKSLAEMGRRSGGRTWAVLGEMKELGAESLAAHDEVGRLAVRLNISGLVAVGAAARPVHLGAAQEGSWNGESRWEPDAAAAVAWLRGQVRPGDVVLVKASRGVALESVAQALLEDAP